MDEDEIKEMSDEWLQKVAKSSYIQAIMDRESAAFAEVQKNLSPVDHIRLIFQLLPQEAMNYETAYKLAWSFWEQAQLLSDAEIRQFTPLRVIGMGNMAQSAFNMQRDDLSVVGRWRLFALCFRLGMAQEVSYYLE